VRIAKNEKQYITILFNEHSITCALISKNSNSFPYTLLDYHTYSLSGYVHAPMQLFNISLMHDVLATFFNTSKKNQPPVLAGFANSLAFEHIVTHDKATPVIDEFKAILPAHVNADYYFLYPDHAGMFVFYLCALSQPMIFQTQLLVQKNDLCLMRAMPAQAALLKLYQKMYGPAFRSHQLAVDLKRAGNIINNLFFKETIFRLLHFKRDICITSKEEQLNLLAMIGLVAAQESR
jgi:hypothetical protein